ncbi:short-chain dehydrogenase/reductase [Ancylobacter sp. A5.8]|uniref:short-chain dehydrogenase/reductase n=1 Tax=Ancylobacter gelatini TaxID=2919920 RepID=UPI001F4EB1BA|nr:short-chain dehydrogenase/reductase [Ancylobacter gelatini]MCJ8144005.1 short-chain dehydrogenase/reductase [Ancylobacter gelatini]
MELNLKGRRALITGASRGIGRAIADALAREGCDLVLAARSAEALEAARTEIHARHGVRVETRVVDLSRLEDVEAVGESAGDIDILVNNAGAAAHGHLLDVPDAMWQEGWALKVHGTIRMSRVIYAAMKARGGGVIVNIIGYAGERVNGHFLVGSTGNASLIAFTRALGSVSPADNIRVVGINPGPVLTDRLRTRLEKSAAEKLGDATRWRELTRSYPFGRPALPEEVADAACFLASPRAAYVTGTTLTLDGGLTYRPPTE